MQQYNQYSVGSSYGQACEQQQEQQSAQANDSYSNGNGQFNFNDHRSSHSSNSLSQQQQLNQTHAARSSNHPSHFESPSSFEPGSSSYNQYSNNNTGASNAAYTESQDHHQQQQQLAHPSQTRNNNNDNNNNDYQQQQQQSAAAAYQEQTQQQNHFHQPSTTNAAPPPGAAGVSDDAYSDDFEREENEKIERLTREKDAMSSEIGSLKSQLASVKKELVDANLKHDPFASTPSPAPSTLSYSRRREGGARGTAAGGGDVNLQRTLDQVNREKNLLQDRVLELSAASVVSGQNIATFNLADVQTLGECGSGGFAAVVRASWFGAELALKRIINPNVVDEENMREFENEVNVLARLRHPNIVMLVALTRSPRLAILSEYVDGGNVNELLYYPKEFKASAALRAVIEHRGFGIAVAKQFCLAVGYLHRMGIVHRDLKPHNMLLTRNGMLKLCDFGLSQMRSDVGTGSQQWAGTPNYLALEVFDRKNYNEKVDIYAVGNIIWELVTRCIPFDGLDGNMIHSKLKDYAAAQGNSRVDLLKFPVTFPADLKTMVQSCWKSDWNRRPDMPEIEKVMQRADCSGLSLPA